MEAASPVQEHDSFIRIEEVMRRTSQCKTAIYNLQRSDPQFPKAMKLGRCAVWSSSEINAWVSDRVRHAPRKA